MAAELSRDLILEVLEELDLETTLPEPVVAGLAGDVLQGKSETEVVSANAQNLDERSAFGSLDDIRTVAEYLVAIRTIYQVIASVGASAEFRAIIERLRKEATQVYSRLSETEVALVVRRFLGGKSHGA